MPAISSSGERPIALAPLGAVGADREAMRLVAQPLQEVEHRDRAVRARRAAGRAGRSARARRCGRDPWRSRRSRTSSMPSSAEHLLRRGELALAAVDQHQIGPHAALALGILLQGAGEAAAQHLAHHRVIVAAASRRRWDPRASRRGAASRPRTADVEFAVGVLHQPVGAGDDHRADRVAALDVAVVVDLDAVERRLQPERRGDAVEQLALRGAFGEAAAERLARRRRRCGRPASSCRRAAAPPA